jgi:formylglycine-generating enzyme required for sulfatase activity
MSFASFGPMPRARKLFAVGVGIIAGSVALRGHTPEAHADGLVASSCPPGFVRVPSGTFMMGSPMSDGDADEHPQHALTLPGFCMQRLEVTVAEYEACINAGNCTPTGTESQCNSQHVNRANHPINCVDWNQAMTYCNYIGARLPTEPEWEYAARGSDGRKYPWGNQPPNAHLLNACGDECVSYAASLPTPEVKHAMYAGSDGYPETSPVGSYPRGASPFGVLDIAGNVYEWTSSPYCTYPQHQCPSQYRMYRGAGWYTEKTAAVATRNGNLITDRSVVVGIRCAK